MRTRQGRTAGEQKRSAIRGRSPQNARELMMLLLQKIAPMIEAQFVSRAAALDVDVEDAAVLVSPAQSPH